MTGLEEIDCLVLGGGSAGCALAARLSEDARRRVVLVEAGQDLRAGLMPPDIASSYPGRAFLQSRFTWPGLTALMASTPGNALRPPGARFYEQARILGGGSSINAMAANRGAPGDYDEWASLGATGWSWAEVLPYFRKLEHDHDFAGPLHGQDGPIPIRRPARTRLSAFAKACVAAVEEAGHPAREDQNGVWQDGVFPMAIAAGPNGQRVPAATAYLTDAVRARRNLRILTETQIRRLKLADRQVVGAEIFRNGISEILLARQVILCCGAIHSPAILLRSGIGPAPDLAALGTAVVAALPGVGRNLMEHPGITLSAYLHPAARLVGRDTHQIQACLRFSSGQENCPAGDMHMAIVARAAWHAVGQRLGTLFVWVNKSYSRGSVTLRSAAAEDEPLVDFALMSDWRDRMRLRNGFLYAAKIFASAQLHGVCGTAFPASFSDRVRRVSAPRGRNAAKMLGLGLALDLSFGLRDKLIQRVITQGVTLAQLCDDEAALDAFLAQAAGGVWHASGTCRMGGAGDTLAVTDPAGRVYGVGGLRVCDASLMPAIPCANTNLPTLMIAERIADIMKAEGTS